MRKHPLGFRSVFCFQRKRKELMSESWKKLKMPAVRFERGKLCARTDDVEPEHVQGTSETPFNP